jgi:hypothetical protein
MRPQLTAAACLGIILTCLAALGVSEGRATDLKLEAQLLWGTDDTKPPPGKNWKPADPAVTKKIPLKWKNYFEVNRKSFVAKAGETRKEPMSDKCQIEVKNLDNSNVEVTLFGKGREVMNRKQALPKGEILVLGGNAPNDTAWLVILRQAE